MLGRDVGDGLAQEPQLGARVRHVGMRRGRDFDLRLQHLAHHLSAGDGFHLLEESLRHFARDRFGLGVDQKILLLDAELEIVGHVPPLPCHCRETCAPSRRGEPRLRANPAAVGRKRARTAPIPGRHVASGNARRGILVPVARSDVSASRRARPEPARAPRPPRYRRAGCAARATSRTMFGSCEQRARSSSANPPSGPISTLTGGPGEAAARAESAATGSFDVGVLVAEHQQPIRRPAAQQRVELLGSAISGNVENAALLGGLDRVGAHALEIDALGLGVARQHRLQPRGAHLDRLLHHVVEPRVLERREQVMQVGGRRSARAVCADRRRAPASLPAAAKRARHSPSRPLNTRSSAPGLSRRTLTR